MNLRACAHERERARESKREREMDVCVSDSEDHLFEKCARSLK